MALPLVLGASGLALLAYAKKHVVSAPTTLLAAPMLQLVAVELAGSALATALSSWAFAVDLPALIALTGAGLLLAHLTLDRVFQLNGLRTLPFIETTLFITLSWVPETGLLARRDLWQWAALVSMALLATFQLRVLSRIIRAEDGQPGRHRVSLGFNLLVMATLLGAAAATTHLDTLTVWNIAAPVFGGVDELGLDAWPHAGIIAAGSLFAFEALQYFDLLLFWSVYAGLVSACYLSMSLWSTPLSKSLGTSLPYAGVVIFAAILLARHARLIDLPRMSSYSNILSPLRSSLELDKGDAGGTVIYDVRDGLLTVDPPVRPNSSQSNASSYHMPNEQGGSSLFDKLLAMVGLLIFVGAAVHFSVAPIDFATIDTRGNKRFGVVTTINWPTDTMDALCALTDWEIVVVADKKTPPAWKAGACHYLSVADQRRLPLRTVKHLPFKAYTRKNLGYLYAIALGAETIFDTDDDNLPNQGIIMRPVDDPSFLTVYNADIDAEPVINPYAHFGRPDIWPRGLPLNKFDQRKNATYLFGEDTPMQLAGRALVQQGLADLDPDVDAIFRLLNAEDIAQVRFCRNVPPIKLARGILSPYNSQNTLWARDAFIGLLLPISVTFRATDIVRSYWAQRLLWDVDGSLAFDFPSVDQIRNPHDYLVDMESESLLYLDVPRMVHFLQNWRSSSMQLDERMLELIGGMVNAGFLKRTDLLLAQAWVADLRDLGLEFPDVQPWQKEETVKAAANAQDLISTDRLQDVAWVASACSPEIPVFNDILLVTHFAGYDYSAAPGLQDLHNRYFPRQAYFGPEAAPQPFGLDIVADLQGLGYSSLLQIMTLEPHEGGYLLLDSQTAVNPHALALLPRDELWLASNFFQIESGEVPTAVSDAIAALSEKQRTNLGGRIYIGLSDFVYVPPAHVEELKAILQVFVEHRVSSEYAVATALQALKPELDFIIPASGLSFSERPPATLSTAWYIAYPVDAVTSQHKTSQAWRDWLNSCRVRWSSRTHADIRTLYSVEKST